MRTIYVIGKPLKFKKDKHNLPIMFFTGQELLSALDDEANSDQLRLFNNWVDADFYLGCIPQPAVPLQFSATPIYRVKLPESQVCEIKESAIKETATSISARTTQTRVGRPPTYTPPGCEVTTATESYISAKVIRNKIIGFDFGSKSIVDDDINHFPEAEKLTATIAYFEEETLLRKDPRYSQGDLFACQQLNQSRKAKLPELKPAELYPLLNSVFDEMYPSGQLSKEEAMIFYQAASKVVREQHDRMYQKNWNWSAFFTFICCIPLVTLPFVSLIFDSILEKISESDPIQNKKISTASAGTLSKINILPADATLHKNNLFNKHGELRKIKNGDSSEPRAWLGTAGQMHCLFTTANTEETKKHEKTSLMVISTHS